MGFLITFSFSVFTVVVLGRLRRPSANESASRIRLNFSPKRWLLITGLVAASYALLYSLFGYFVAWRNPTIREFYGVDELAGFVSHMLSSQVLTRVIPLQLVRGVMWLGIALLIVRSHHGGWIETAIAVAASFAVLMNAQLLLPNPIMPEDVRVIHLIETATSNFLFGLVLVWILWVFGDSEDRRLASNAAVTN